MVIFLKIIGLCGGSGSGRGAVSDIFKELGYPTIDTDMVYREITSYMSPCLDELVLEFGTIILRDNSLDRRALANLVFGGAEASDKIKRLNEITHKHVLNRTRELISKLNDCSPLVLVEVPLLFESGFDKECDVIIAVVADRDTRIARIVKRDGISIDEASKRIDAQLDNSFLIANSDYTVYNNQTPDILRGEVKNIIALLKKEI